MNSCKRCNKDDYLVTFLDHMSHLLTLCVNCAVKVGLVTQFEEYLDDSDICYNVTFHDGITYY